MKKRGKFTLFAYGSLKDPIFVKRLLGKHPKMISARLKGYQRLRIPSFKYPIAVKQSKASINGKLILELTKDDFKKIEKWERTPQNFYKKIRCSIKVGGERKDTFVYIREKRSLCKVMAK